MSLQSYTTRFALIASCGVLLAACSDDNGIATPNETIAPVALKNQSVTPALLKSLVSGVERGVNRRFVVPFGAEARYVQ